MTKRKNFYNHHIRYETDMNQLRKAAKRYLAVRCEYYDSRLDKINYALFSTHGHLGTIGFFPPEYWDRGYWYNCFVHEGSEYHRVEYKIPWQAIENFKEWKKTFIARRERQIARRKKWEEKVSTTATETSSNKETIDEEYELFLKLKKKYADA